MQTQRVRVQRKYEREHVMKLRSLFSRRKKNINLKSVSWRCNNTKHCLPLHSSLTKESSWLQVLREYRYLINDVAANIYVDTTLIFLFHFFLFREKQ